MTCVLLAGGSGTRLWPLSRRDFPKQFLPLESDGSMLENTVRRLQGSATEQSLLTVSGEAHRFIVQEHLQRSGHAAGDIILEPCARNTAPAIAVAALHVAATQGPQTVMLATPADHVVRDAEAFRAGVRRAAVVAAEGQLVTFGIDPDRPETGYGYIQAGDARADGALELRRFVEKPDAATAAEYLRAGDYYWNAGVFVFTAAAMLDEMRALAPEIVTRCEAALAGARRDGHFLRLDEAAFAACPEDSIDYAVMEKTRRAVVIPLRCGWNDVGSWNSLTALGAADAHGNVCQGEVLQHDCERTAVHARSRMVATIGLRDTVVVETSDAVLVARADQVQEVKQIATRLAAQGRDEAIQHPRVPRPWGAYEGVDRGPRHQVKRITVNPGQKLSLQLHRHRAEHWIVVKGTARVTRGEEVFTLHEDQSTYIPLGTRHRLENPGESPLEIIEVQTGGYLGEDDIERFEDDYGRES